MVRFRDFERKPKQTCDAQKKSEEQQGEVDEFKVGAILGSTKPVKVLGNDNRSNNWDYF